jgi:7,8-dihydroneopterin aldolase/epimerase/oxygenase
MLSVLLKDLRFFAYHGLYEEERKLGNDFTVNVEVQYKPASLPVLQLEETIDYTAIYRLVKKRMEQPTALLETVITEIAVQILQEFKMAEAVEISLHKIHPPILQFQGSTGVRFLLRREDI